MAEKLLEVRHLRTEFKREKGYVTAVNDVSFFVRRGEVLGLVGESGCGKTVTALSVMGLLADTSGRVTNGEVWLHGRDLLRLSRRERRSVRGRDLAMIFQNPMSSLNPCMRVERQLQEAILLHNHCGRSGAAARAREVLEAVGIPDADRVLRSYPHQLSGGMSQRVMIAMALSCEPDLMIADEPTTALDVTIQAQIMELMLRLKEERDSGILLITHDLGVVAEMCSRVIVMYAGRIVEEAPVEELFARPLHPYTMGLIASVPKIGSGVRTLPSIPGNVPDLAAMPQGCKFAPRCRFATEQCRQREPELTQAEGSPARRVRCHGFDEGRRILAEEGGDRR